MPSRMVTELIGGTPIDAYLRQCQVRNTLVEGEQGTHVPPTPDETKYLLGYLKKLGIETVIVGSVGVLHYVKDTRAYRPTVDLDLFVKISHKEMQAIVPPMGWKHDLASPGVISWVSPTGGYVDFMTSGHVFPDGNTTPKSVAPDPSSKEYPVAKAVELFRLKLNTMREKDLSDLMSLARALGRVPSDKELGPLNQTQEENLSLIRQWYKIRPSGKYGE